MDYETEEHEQFACPPHVYRHSHDDDYRTKLLKEVLRSTAALQEAENKGKSRSRNFMSVEGPSFRAKKPMPRRTTPVEISLQDLAACQHLDEESLAMVGSAADAGEGLPASPLLRGCGKRIAALCGRLEEAEATLSRVQSETKLAASSGLHSDSEIRITDRPEEALVRARNDRVVYDFVSKHATFDRLEAFKDTVERAEGMEALRQVFPRRFHYHPNMVYLNDDVLKDPAKLKAAIWSQHSPKESAADIQKTRLQSRAAVGLRVSMVTSGSNLAQRRANARGMRKDRSSPSL